MSNFDNLTIIDKLNITLSNLNMTYLVGKIKIYAGTTLPEGYVWCDGTNGTPDLTNNNFIISDQSDGNQQQTGNNSFANNMIEHTHSIQTTSNVTDMGFNFNPDAVDISMRNVYNDVANYYIERPTSGLETSVRVSPGGNMNIQKQGNRDRLSSHHHDIDEQTTYNTPVFIT